MFPFSEGCLEKLVQFHGEHLVSSPFDHQEAAPKSTKVTEETVEPKVEPKETKETETKVDDDAGVEGVNCYRLGLNFTQKNCTITCHVGKKNAFPHKKKTTIKKDAPYWPCSCTIYFPCGLINWTNDEQQILYSNICISIRTINLHSCGFVSLSVMKLELIFQEATPVESRWVKLSFLRFHRSLPLPDQLLTTSSMPHLNCSN